MAPEHEPAPAKPACAADRHDRTVWHQPGRPLTFAASLPPEEIVCQNRNCATARHCLYLSQRRLGQPPERRKQCSEYRNRSSSRSESSWYADSSALPPWRPHSTPFVPYHLTSSAQRQPSHYLTSKGRLSPSPPSTAKSWWSASGPRGDTPASPRCLPCRRHTSCSEAKTWRS